MNGKELKKILREEGVNLSELATKLGFDNDQRLHSALRAEDVKSGLLESIAIATNKNIGFFYGYGQPALSGDMLAYLREKDNEIRELRARIDELTRELHEREIEIVELKKENLPVAKRADVAESSQKVG